MKNLVHCTTVIHRVINSLNRASWQRGFLLIPLALGFGFFALPAAGQADCREGCWFGSTFLGEDAFVSVLPYLYDTAIGGGALSNPGDGLYNVAVGHVALHDNGTGWYNTALGAYSMSNNTTGTENTAIGGEAMHSNTTGSSNVANGKGALYYNTTGTGNTGTGRGALSSNETGNNNTATGYAALVGDHYSDPTTGSENTATGSYALYSNTGGSYNTANGSGALYGNTTGISNTASGWGALNLNTTGDSNVADGLQALLNNTIGNENTAVGLNALFSNTTGSRNTALGAGAGGALTTGSDNIDIGTSGVAGESATIRIGTIGTHKNSYIAGIYTVALGRAAVPVFVDSAGHLGTKTSAARFKEAVQPMDNTSEAILALQPVTFRYKKEFDPDGTAQFGLIAEEVAKVNPDLVVRDEEGKPYTVRYEAVNAMLLNEFLKEHRKGLKQDESVAQLEATGAKHEATIAQQQKDFRSTIAQQQKEIEALTASLKEQASQIQKVSEQLAAASPSSGTFSNLPDGAVLTVNGNNFEASYEGGDGNDLALTVVP